MNLYKNRLYCEDIEFVAGLNLPWNRLKGRSVLISGAAGMIGSFLVDVIMLKNLDNLDCKIYALGRNEQRAKNRFSKWITNDYLQFISYNINKPLSHNDLGTVDYIFHLASNTHPLQYSSDPIGTITTNIIGLQNMLEFGVTHNVTRFVFTSSNEIYGENRGDIESFREDYCGYINSNTMRAGYPESKRCGETLCQAYKAQKNVDVVIPRLTRTYGPTMLMSDTKAISQFIRKAIADEDIVLKSTGTQYYSYTYVADAVSGLLTVVLMGESGEAYNVADEASDIMLKDLAEKIAVVVGKRVVFELPDVIEKAGYSKAKKARLDGTKLKMLGWNPKYNIDSGIRRTIEILKCME